MKILKFKTFLWALLLVPIWSASLVSCSKDDDNEGNAPLIESVSKTGYTRTAGNAYIPIDSLTTTGFSGNLYVIRGKGFMKTSKIYFNDFEAYFNPTMVTDTNIIVQIPVGVPYSNAETSNKLKIVTLDGKEILYDFTIGQPAPNILKYPLGGPAGGTFTITGTDFLNLQSVKFGTAEAEIVSFTEDEIVAKIPAGITAACKIFVKTPGGISESPKFFGYNYKIYDESLTSDWSTGGWGGAQTYDETAQSRDGNFSMKKIYNAWEGFGLNKNGNAVDLTGYTKFKFSIYGKNAGKVKIIFGDWNNNTLKMIDLAPGQWVDYEIPFSELGTNTSSISFMVFQEFSGISNEIYVDDMGFL